jgi:hypothetical protein
VFDSATTRDTRHRLPSIIESMVKDLQIATLAAYVKTSTTAVVTVIRSI